jgi:hypothetical protein
MYRSVQENVLVENGWRVRIVVKAG